MSNAEKFCISLSSETLNQMDFLKKAMHLNPSIKRSQLIAQIIFDCFASYSGMHVDEEMRERSGSHLCRKDG